MNVIFALVMMSYTNPGHVATVRYYDTIGECQKAAWDLNKNNDGFMYQCWMRTIGENK